MAFDCRGHRRPSKDLIAASHAKLRVFMDANAEKFEKIDITFVVERAFVNGISGDGGYDISKDKLSLSLHSQKHIFFIAGIIGSGRRH